MSVRDMGAALKGGLRRWTDGERAQGVVEAAIALPFLLTLVLGMIDFGFIFSDRVALANAARDGARYAATNPTMWSSASSPALNTIQGQIMNAGGAGMITNDNSHIAIAYENADGSACGTYSVSTNSVSPSTCVVKNNLIKVSLTYTYSPITPGAALLFQGGVQLTNSATMVEEK